ncbi:DNA-binding HxlR family transcriptional regulator [Deinococcus metalli]|uniref:Transcriptional regulator n=1 Tax=Deinococcus metalli TaxID=1141878 RepID=A0A7W8KF21_9DEIO|nr:winged helix-turn-helix transcriptional regulator [Deinococcus metalli]MBB5377004.1 DNA-binding HxlR family transcriptional regulator [Deinococcus metalli]GHF46984.1 transcriptional regulator [Deinococcus metalli]
MTSARAPERRSYGDGCAAAHALDLIGERWALLVVRELLLGPRRFTDLKTALPGISATVLTQRLSDLEDVGVVVREQLPPPAASWTYALTPWGQDLEPVLMQLGRWGARSPHRAPAPISVATLITAQRTMFSAVAAAGVDANVHLRPGRDIFTARVQGGTFQLTPGAQGTPDATLSGDVAGLGAVLFGGLPLDVAEADGVLGVTGDRVLAARYATLFPLPPTVAAVRKG